MRGVRSALLAAAAAMSVAGCENWNSIFRTTDLGGGTTIITDAKQRAIINVDDYRRGGSHRIVCAEPSPDVAQAMQTAFQAGASVSRGDTKVDANLALAMATQIAQLGERLAAIQLLREKMYRACEAYANGATTQGGYISMLARVDKTMTTMLATEMAAGAFGRNLASAGGSAATSPGADPAKVKAASDEAKVAAKAFEDAQAALAANEDESKRPQLLDAALKTANTMKEKATALVQLELARAGMTAGGTASGNIGKIDGGNKGFDAAAVMAIHRNYIDDDGIEGIVDACVTELSRARYAYEDFLDMAKKENLYPGANRSVPSDSALTVSATTSRSDYDQHFKNFMQVRMQFANYCTRSVLIDTPGSQSPFIAQRVAAKEKLRAMAERSTLIQQCAPVLRAKAWSEGEKALYNYCLAAMRG